MSRELLGPDSRVGFTYLPGLKARVRHESGGYILKTNRAGFRCDHEFVPCKPPNTVRALLFGDSFTAGNGVSNSERYGDLLEALIPKLQVFNYALPGAAPDQQYVTYQEFAHELEHDVLILAVHVQNVRRVRGQFRLWTNASGEIVVHAKPYYVLEEGCLRLKHVPVPLEGEKYEDWVTTHPMPNLALPPDQTEAGPTLRRRSTGKPPARGYQPLPEYDEPENPDWRLLAAILREWIDSSDVPVVLVPLPYHAYVEGRSDPSSYQARFRELADVTACTLHDPLPDLLRHPIRQRRRFRFRVDPHPTAAGHRAIASSLAPVVTAVLRRSRRGVR
ncbi:MAG: hypothetical protein DMF91_13270 [Acidobacteria bacterium]|nr:MAG: hypothetical protein DMF91_13270 [Acidobacteriota bacterium]